MIEADRLTLSVRGLLSPNWPKGPKVPGTCLSCRFWEGKGLKVPGTFLSCLKSHAFGQITLEGDVAYFDLGSSTSQGHYGGDDHLFFEHIGLGQDLNLNQTWAFDHNDL